MTYQCQVNHTQVCQGLVSAGCYVTEDELGDRVEKINMQRMEGGGMASTLSFLEVLRLMWGPLLAGWTDLTCVRKRTVAGICSSSVCTGQYVKFLKWVFPLKTYGQFKVDTVIILLLQMLHSAQSLSTN